MYELIVFDLDGTLIDSAPDIAAALNSILADCGLATHTEEMIRRMIGSGVVELVRRALVASGAPTSDERKLVELAKAFRAQYATHLLDRTALYPEVEKTLSALSQRKAIATNKPGAVARQIVEKLGIAPHFFAVLGEDDVGKTKPDPRIVDEIVSRAKVDRERVLFVGDSAVDMETAENANVDLCLVSYGYGDSQAIAAAGLRRKPKFVIDRFELLPLALGRRQSANQTL